MIILPIFIFYPQRARLSSGAVEHKKRPPRAKYLGQTQPNNASCQGWAGGRAQKYLKVRLLKRAHDVTYCWSTISPNANQGVKLLPQGYLNLNAFRNKIHYH